MDHCPPFRTELYPPTEPFDRGMLRLDDIHTMSWELSGNPQGIPVVFLHGGPGGGCAPEHRRFFDPAVFKVVGFDQRGAGHSTPTAETRQNTTAHLVQDIETLRQYLGITRWLIFGGSWGATLGLAYGQAHPHACLGFVLRGIFLGRRSEIDWFFWGMRHVFPEAWRSFVEMLPPQERADPLKGYCKRLFHPEPKVHLPFARAWSEYEAACSTLRPNPDLARHFSYETLALARLEAHYFLHECFLAPNQLLDNLYRMAHLPASLVQARYDIVCPIINAESLARAWPSARFCVVPEGGHSVWEPNVRAVVMRELEWMKRQLI